ncbi:hypothetical protein BLOT_009458 [Blomia tropicalis]|nr:hypothetical protein BLOT_009458 [Blomia tropicalis]
MLFHHSIIDNTNTQVVVLVGVRNFYVMFFGVGFISYANSIFTFCYLSSRMVARCRIYFMRIKRPKEEEKAIELEMFENLSHNN